MEPFAYHTPTPMSPFLVFPFVLTWLIYDIFWISSKDCMDYCNRPDSPETLYNSNRLQSPNERKVKLVASDSCVTLADRMRWSGERAQLIKYLQHK